MRKGLTKTDGFAGAHIKSLRRHRIAELRPARRQSRLQKLDAGLEPDRHYPHSRAASSGEGSSDTYSRLYASATPELPGVDLLMVGDGLAARNWKASRWNFAYRVA